MNLLASSTNIGDQSRLYVTKTFSRMNENQRKLSKTPGFSDEKVTISRMNENQRKLSKTPGLSDEKVTFRNTILIFDPTEIQKPQEDIKKDDIPQTQPESSEIPPGPPEHSLPTHHEKRRKPIIWFASDFEENDLEPPKDDEEEPPDFDHENKDIFWFSTDKDFQENSDKDSRSESISTIADEEENKTNDKSSKNDDSSKKKMQ